MKTFAENFRSRMSSRLIKGTRHLIPRRVYGRIACDFLPCAPFYLFPAGPATQAPIMRTCERVVVVVSLNVL